MADYIRKTKKYNGKQYVAYGKTEYEAMEKLAEKMAEVKRGEELLSDSMTVSAWYKQWLETYKKPKGLTDKSLGMYDEKFNKYIRPRIGTMKLRDVKEAHLQRILNEQEGMSYSHCSKVRIVLQQMFKRARQSRLIIHDPAELLELPRSKKGTRRSITDEERAAILSVAETSRSGLWILTLLYTGMRRGEALALSYSDIDRKAGVIHVTKKLSYAANGQRPQMETHLKSKNGERDIPLLKPLADALPKDHIGLIFPGEDGGFMKSSEITKNWKHYCRDVGLNEMVYGGGGKAVETFPITPHCFRHSFATICYEAGLDPRQAAEILGDTPEVLEGVYTHLRDGRRQTAAEKLTAYFGQVAEM